MGSSRRSRPLCSVVPTCCAAPGTHKVVHQQSRPGGRTKAAQDSTWGVEGRPGKGPAHGTFGKSCWDSRLSSWRREPLRELMLPGVSQE